MSVNIHNLMITIPPRYFHAPPCSNNKQFKHNQILYFYPPILFLRNQLRNLKTPVIPVKDEKTPRETALMKSFLPTTSLCETKRYKTSKSVAKVPLKYPPVPLPGNQHYKLGELRRYSPFHYTGQVTNFEYDGFAFFVKVLMA